MPLGGGQEIGANSYLLHSQGHDVLLDCGVHPKKDGMEALPDFSLLDRSPDSAIISHGHVDHCGALPRFLHQFPASKPYATKATVSIMDRMLHNSVSVMGMLAKERNIQGYPLYTHEDVDYAIRRSTGFEYGYQFALDAGGTVVASLHPAGHVLGGASVLLRTPGHTIFYTGDICAADQELIAGHVPLDESIDVHTLIIECTYGADADAGDKRYEDEIVRFAQGITRVIERGGVVLVPSFALGRTQELLNIIARLQESGLVPWVPVMASGLGRAIYEVYHSYADHLRPGADFRPLSQFKRIGDVWNRKNAQELLRKPAIVVATSGMMIENTPSALIAQEMVQHKEHGIFFVGYLDPDSLGYRLLHAEPDTELQFQLNMPQVKVVLDTVETFYFSAHAPREALRDVITRVRPHNLIFVHGDPDAVAWMYENAGNGCRKFAPTVGETLVLEP
jgi:Cft2 family RNA processing exonuclease